MVGVLALPLVAVALGIDNLVVAIGIGLSGAGGRLRARVAVVFGLFEGGMPLVGLLLGHGVTAGLGSGARWLGGGLLVAVGGYGIVAAWRERRSGDDDLRRPGPYAEWRLWRMVVSGLALSVDNLAVGFALGAYRVPVGLAVAVIAVVSVAMSLAGLELGARLGRAAGAHGELAAGVVLVGVGVAMSLGAV